MQCAAAGSARPRTCDLDGNGDTNFGFLDNVTHGRVQVAGLAIDIQLPIGARSLP
jgi:hypothetical protein